MKRIVPVTAITEISLGQNEDGIFQLLFQWGDGEGKIYFVNSQEILDTILNELILPNLADPNVAAWLFDDEMNLPDVIVRN